MVLWLVDQIVSSNYCRPVDDQFTTMRQSDMIQTIVQRHLSFIHKIQCIYVYRIKDDHTVRFH
jgi:hypothetical protein